MRHRRLARSHAKNLHARLWHLSRSRAPVPVRAVDARFLRSRHWGGRLRAAERVYRLPEDHTWRQDRQSQQSHGLSEEEGGGGRPESCITSSITEAEVHSRFEEIRSYLYAKRRGGECSETQYLL